MSELVPTRQASTLQTAILDYLTTTFALADSDAASGLEALLRHGTDGIFKGPFVRTRLPFERAVEGWRDALDVLPPGFEPYGHQAEAFKRLSSRDGRPRPTLVTTGTGSGKTEAFLLPILDHVVRERRRSQAGIKALILYPMNALANDQAGRLASLITASPTTGEPNPYADITAGLYTGESEYTGTTVTKDRLIMSRTVLRSQPPDILLTNYKMLDQLLLRAEDAGLWAKSADSLQYVVLDEFHTYDGAQGTDVAMLLRRLGLALKSYWPQRGAPGDNHTDADWARPLGRVTPVGTSATLGDGAEATAMLGFASEVFGGEFTPDAVVTESRLSLDAYLADAALPAGYEAATPTESLAWRIADDLEPIADPAELTNALLRRLVLPTDPDGTELPDLGPAEQLAILKALPGVRALLDATRSATSLDELAAAIVPDSTSGTHSDAGPALVSLLVAALSHVRAQLGRDVAGVEVHLWVRELSRIDRLASSATTFRWSDDGMLAPQDATEAHVPTFPAIFCRHCGRSGWGVELATTGTNLSASDNTIRANHLARTGRFRALIHATSEGQRALTGETMPGLHWLNSHVREVRPELPDPDEAAYRNGQLLPVLALMDADADDASRDDTCPSCGRRDGIRFLGSAISTLLSVSLSSLFGSGSIDAAEKKALVFTDSVQDAAHRAGFVAARSHTLTLRSVLRDALADTSGAINLVDLAHQAMSRAGSDPFRRYRLLPPALASHPEFKPFYEAVNQQAVPPQVRTDVLRRLAFDAALEFGMNSHLGRTLEATGSVAVHVDAGSPAAMANHARQTITHDEEATLDGDFPDERLVQWVRGVVEHLRTQGGIDHDWLDAYRRADGSRWLIWGGRRPLAAMPAFPKGRPAPAFARVGGKKQREPLLDPVTEPQSWYARWTAKVLGVSPGHGARLAAGLLERLGKASVLSTVLTDSGGKTYGLRPSSVLVATTTAADLTAGRHHLSCDLCHSGISGSVEAIGQLRGAPCVLVRCPGRLAPQSVEPGNFYRRLYASADMRRIVAREHTSLLDTDTRRAYETGFKQGQSAPQSPNVLVATPTLEMGIDIGDLSAVFLASLPRTVASYLQRVGRAGRQTGNALNLAYVRGRGENLARLGDPASLINGDVRPPAIYLSAEEILRRQYLASLVDDFARDPHDHHHPRTAAAALAQTQPGSFLGDLLAHHQAHADTLVERFVATLGERARPEAVAALRAWASVDEQGTSGLARHVLRASGRWVSEREALQHRRDEIMASIPALQQAASIAAASEEDKRALRTADAALRLVNARLLGMEGIDHQFWIAALEEQGILPNYTLIGDATRLEVSITTYDPQTDSYTYDTTDVLRPTAQALREFAPGATFYARGLEIQVDALDLGTEADSIRTFAFCPDCGYAVDLHQAGHAEDLGPCPRCGSDGLVDTGQHVEVVELKRASAAIRRDEALIDDRQEDRATTAFTIALAADIDPAGVRRAWSVEGTGFGVKHCSHVTLRWLNVGRRAATASPLEMAGNVLQASRFRVCEGCGHVDATAQGNAREEHRPWCRYRNAAEDHVRSIVLSRTLSTQGVLIALPYAISHASSLAVPSLQAALLLGLREEFGGSPDHIGVAQVVDPVLGGPNIEALLLHDTVPGGTGYLADLANPQSMWQLLRTAHGIVRECPCQSEGRQACQRCLLPFAPPYGADLVSRAAAEQLLRQLLIGAGEGEPPASHGWTIKEGAVEPNLETPIEIRVREGLKKVATNIGGTISEVPSADGAVMLIRLGTATFRLTPQVSMGGVKPDFYLTSSLGGGLALFADGFKYHATPAHNRVADDAQKRTMLRASGIESLAFTWADVTRFEAGDETPPDWFNGQFEPQLRTMYGFSARAAEVALAGPFAIVGAWMQQHATEDAGQFAAALPLAMTPVTRVSVAKRASLTELASALLHHEPEPAASGANAWWWRQGQVGLLAGLRDDAGATSPSIDVVVVIDASDEATASASFKESWQSWLALRNALAFRPISLETQFVVLGSEVTQSAPAPEAPKRIDVSYAWETALRVIYVPGAEQLVSELSALDIPVSDWIGEEIGEHGIPVDLAWSNVRVAVQLEPNEADERDLVSEGWQVVPPEASAIARALGGVR